VAGHRGFGVSLLFWCCGPGGPGVVPLAAWRPDTLPADPHEAYYYAALARRD